MKFLVSLVLLTIVACKTSSNIVVENLLKTASITAEKWVGGRSETGFGYSLELVLKEPLSKNIQLVSITYKNTTAIIKQQTETHFIAKTITQNTDYGLSNNVLDEVKNTIPQKNFIKIKPNEALVVYKFNNKNQTIILSNIKEKTPLLMP